MKILIMLLVICPNIYTFSYARYAWESKNKAGAAGILILMLAALLLPFFIIVLR
ncbi:MULTISPECIES: hypothetical protein [Oscillospiraceae]|uniref:Uncharacterized protein n=1 Tax=Pseudobacteroides cellulosolvens ATCC 35603 = DSM 2933 TaxID=398512 RepID=A0A0L6JTA8_9FIRM|nr:MULTISPECIES: hypothetical protein [Oscillospiraceae]KNY29086.1 hypothetical protein Bccel_4360 [Pseudobacteroides cellulosolvens ATCC 35603 = DSM 2933]